MSALSAIKCTEAPRQCLEPCGCLPSGFSRLKYFYGKHLSVADFKDEQRYHISKDLLHNQRLHGSGVLCGLDICIDDAAPLELRIKTGSAQDQCGRVIIVPHDQCVDVAAWYRAHYDYYQQIDPATPCPAQHPNDDGAIVLCVMLRYAECPTGPEAAPRDPCGCGDSGCEFGRISERFQLELMPHAEAVALVEPSMFPNEQQVADALDSTQNGLDLIRRLTKPITAACPGGFEESWIMLGCVEVTPEPNIPGEISDVLESSSSVPPVLLSTEVIQYLLSKIYADLDTVVGAPSIIEVRWRKLEDFKYQIVLMLDNEIDPQSIDADDSFRLRMMKGTGWDEPGTTAVTSAFHTNDPNPELDDNVLGPAIYVSINDKDADFLEAGCKYHLYMGSTPGPIVDSELRSLRPRDFVSRFRLFADEDGDLEMETPPFSPL